MWVAVSIICSKDIESKLAGESTLSRRVSWLSDSFDSAKEDTIGAIKTIGRLRDPRDEVGWTLCHRRVLFNFSGICKEDFQSYMVNMYNKQNNDVTHDEYWSAKKIFTWQLTTSEDKKQETWNRCIIAIKVKIIKKVKNENKCRIFNNENCFRLTFEVLAWPFFHIGNKLNLIFKEQELFIFATAYRTRTLPYVSFRFWLKN